jgi:hypothetical protein
MSHMISSMLSAHVISKERALSTHGAGDYEGLGTIRNVMMRSYNSFCLY